MKNDFWKKVLLHFCVYFTVFAALIFLIYVLMNITDIYKAQFSAARMLFILPFCFAFAVANRFQALEKPNAFAKLAVHAILTLGGFFAFIFAPLVADGAYNPNPLAAVGIAVLIYAVGYGIYFLIHSLRHRKQNKKSEYKPLYGGNKK